MNPQNEKTADSNGAAQDAVDELTGNGETDLKYVGMCFPQFNAPWYVQISDEITSVLEEQGIQVETASCDNNFARQLEIIENYSQKGVDGLVLFPVGASEIGSTLEAMQEQGVRVVVIMNKVDKGYDALLLTDYAEQGRMCAQMAAKWIDETFPDAEPGSIEVGALTVRMSEEADAMSSGMLSIAEYTDKAKQYQYFSTHLWLDMPFIAANKDLMCEAGGLYHCLLVCAQNRRDGILVESEGYDYSRYTAYAADRSALNLRDVPVERHNRKLRQPRSGPER